MNLPTDRQTDNTNRAACIQLSCSLWVAAQTVEDKIRAREDNPDAAVEAAAAEREITISFNADVNDGMPWKFHPTQRSVKVGSGESCRYEVDKM